MKTLEDFDFNGKRVLVRCEFNVPLNEGGVVLDDFRIRKTIPTIEYLLKKNSKIILMCHLGRPQGQVVESLRLTPVQNTLNKYLDVSVVKAQDCISKEVEDLVNQMDPREIILLENLRFHKEEEENNPDFAANLAKLGDIYINDAFGASHRAHASITGIPGILPSGIGLLFKKEIDALENLLKNPPKSLIGIIGGIKVGAKAKVIERISEKADWILVSNRIQDEIENKNIIFKYREKIIMPVDGLGEGNNIYDIGPKTIDLFKEKILSAKAVFWSGPLGMIEKTAYQKGSKEIAKAIVSSGAFSVAGGGETVEFINAVGLADNFSFVSTGGGAMLEFLSGDKLPGIVALENS
ncbi:MAG: phosphoglycerate kinase [Candidatus Parcubacteria bacterium]|nr:phosphoglycerate kinase [Candidatus Parcubacteria bacterium]